MKDEHGASRRDFLKTWIAGTVALSAGKPLVFAAPDQAANEKSKVVIATDANLRAGSGVDPTRMSALLDRAMNSYFGTRDVTEAWKRIVRPGQTVGLKVNTIAGRGLSTNLALVESIAGKLQQAGIKPYDIVIWDRTNRELERAGFRLSSAPNQVRCMGSDAPGAGYEDVPESYGTVSCRLAKLLTRTCDVVINVPLLKHHSDAGMTLSMKNMYGVIDNPYDCHQNNCNPGVADVNMLPTIRRKVRFTIGDATTCCYEGGPGFRPEYAWHDDSLIVGSDPVALDYTGWQIIERKRAEKGLKTLAAVGLAPAYIATAADGHHRLGSNDPRKIAMIRS